MLSPTDILFSCKGLMALTESVNDTNSGIPLAELIFSSGHRVRSAHYQDPVQAETKGNSPVEVLAFPEGNMSHRKSLCSLANLLGTKTKLVSFIKRD